MMQNHIIIYLHTVQETEDMTASWITFDASGTIVQTIAHGNLSQLSTNHENNVYVVLPMQDILLTSTHLPKMSRQRLMQALPFALEEELIDDVSELHFSVGEYQQDNTLPVAIVSKQKMAMWLHLFEQLNITPHAFIPAIFILPLPYTDNSWQINDYNNSCIVRTGKWSGFACEQDNFDTLLALKQAGQSDKGQINLVRTHCY